MKSVFVNKKVLSRLLAFLIDWLIIAAYAAALLGITLVVTSRFDLDISNVSPQIGQLIGFVTLTFPIICYFTFTESGNRHASVGKRAFKIRVYDAELKEPKFSNVLVRNLVKFTPWEIAHFGVHWAIYYDRQNIESPMLVYITLIVPQVIILLYLLSMIINKNNRTIYEIASKTRTY